MSLAVSIVREEPLCIKASADLAAGWGRNDKGYGYWSRSAVECPGHRDFEITVHVAVRPTANSAEFATFPAILEISGNLNDDDVQVGVYAVKHGHATIAIMVPPLEDELEINIGRSIELDRVVLATSTGAHVRMIVSIKLCSLAEAPADDLPDAAPVLVQAEIGVAVHGTSHVSESASGAVRTSEAFIEQTTTAIIFAHGAVVHLAETVVPGQILILRRLASNEEAACRVISVKANGGEKAYVELEFMPPAPGFWDEALAVTNGGRSPDAALARREPAFVSPHATAIPKHVSPAPAARTGNLGSENARSASGTGARHVFSKLMDVPAAVAASEAVRSARTAEAMRSAQPGAGEIAIAAPVEANAEPANSIEPAVANNSSPNVAAEPAKVEAMRSAHAGVAESAVAVAEPAILADAQGEAAPSEATSLAPSPAEAAHAPVAAKWSPLADKAEPVLARVKTMPAVSAKSKAAPFRPAASTPSSAKALDADKAYTWNKQGGPRRANAAGIAVAAAVFGALAAGAAVYHWQRNPKVDANGAAASQSIFSAPGLANAASSSAAPASNAPLSGAPLPTHVAPAASGPTPAAAPSTEIAGTPKKASNTNPSIPPAANAHSNLSLAAGSAASSNNKKPTSAAPPESAPEFAPEPEVAETRIAAPAAAMRSTNQVTPTVADGAPRALQNAWVGSILSDTEQSGGPVAPPPTRTSSGAEQPRLRSAPEPIYPYSARAEKVQGDVTVDMLIDEDGRVASMTVLSGPQMLRQASLDALRQRKYFPAMLDGKATSAHIVVTIHFQL